MNQNSGDGYRLVFSLIGAFRHIIEELHDDLAAQGLADVRPMHGFVLQALGAQAITISELGRRLGVSKQAAAKTVQIMEDLDLVVRTPDPADARAKLISRSPRGEDVLHASVRFFDARQENWRNALGPAGFNRLLDDLEILGGEALPGDFVGWLQGGGKTA